MFEFESLVPPEFVILLSLELKLETLEPSELELELFTPAELD
ncbi:hypothetical protein KF7_1411 [Lactococcus lactis subsp. lactis]|nr:hypothetical protein KF7_1411 [Lactococcus lactis subsp. lactis]